MELLDYIIPAIALIIAIIVPLIRRLTMRKTGAALIDAVNRGDVDGVKALIARGAFVDATNDFLKGTPLIIAAMNGHREIVRILLARGADVNARDMEGWTAMRYATGYGYTEIALLLAKAGARE